MTRTIAGLCAATALGFVATLGAQAPAQTPAPPAQPPTTSAAGSDVKVTGCLAKEGTGFVLNSAMVEAPAPAATGTAGTAGAAGSAAAAIPANIKSATAFKVQGTGLDTHVGQRVELTGAAMAASSSSSSTESSGGGVGGAVAGAAKEAGGAVAGAAKEGAAAATGKISPNAPTLTAKSVRMVAEKC